MCIVHETKEFPLRRLSYATGGCPSPMFQGVIKIKMFKQIMKYRINEKMFCIEPHRTENTE